MGRFTSGVAGLARFLLRFFGFLQWLAGIAIGAFSFSVMLQELDELDPSSIEGAEMFDSAPEMLGGAVEMFGSILAPIALMDSTRTWLLFSILLVVSGIYCHLAARPKPDRL